MAVIGLSWHISATLSAAQAPATFALLAEVAGAIGTPPVSEVVISGRFNAATFRYRRRRIIGIGAPLWAVLDPQQRVALLAHEFGHWAAGDLRETVYVRTALRSMRRWSAVLQPQPATRRRGNGRYRGVGGGLGELAEMLVPYVLLPLALAVDGLGALLLLGAYRQGQRAEYYADQLSAQVAGTAAAVGALEVLLLNDSCAAAMTRLRTFDKARPLLPALAEHAHSIPSDEWDRLRRKGLAQLVRVDRTHPPTTLRTSVVPTALSARVIADAPRMGVIDEELRNPLDAAVGGPKTRTTPFVPVAVASRA